MMTQQKLKYILYLAHTAQLDSLVAEIKPHIITIVETWLNPDVSIALENYAIIRRDRGLIDKSGRYIRGGGLACFIHKSLKSRVLYTSVADHLNQPEFVLIDVSMDTGSHILLAGIYRRPQGYLLDSFLTEFGKLYPHYNNIIITGDLNCNFLKTDRLACHLQSFITEFALYCVPHGPTYHTNGVDSWLDVIIVDNEDKIRNYSKSSAPYIGGHDYIFVEYKLEHPKKCNKVNKYRDFRNCDHLALSQSLNIELNVNNIDVDSLDPNELTSYFLTVVSNYLDIYGPFSERKISRPSNPWLTKELKNKLKYRDAIYKQARRSGDQSLLNYYKKLRSELKVKLNAERDKYFTNILAEESYGSSIWKKLKQLGLIKPKQSSPLDHFSADELNNFYATTLTKHPSCSREFVQDLLLHYIKKVDCEFHWSKIDIVDVTKSLHLTISKSAGKSPDGLDLKWLRDHLAQISLFMTAIFNRSLETSIFPEAWKSKTKVMILGSNRKLKLLEACHVPDIKIDGNIIPYVNAAKHLGLHISNDLSWDAHISQLSRKAYATINSLKYRKNILSMPCRKLLVTTMLLPIIDYCSIVYLDLSKRLDKKLQRIVNNSIRFIFNIKRDEHITPYRHTLKWLSVKSKREYLLACLTYKILETGGPKFLRLLFIDEDLDIRRSNRLAAKNNNIFKMPNFSTAFYEHSFLVSAIRLWQELPTEITNSSSLQIFKNKAYEFFMNKEASS
ncbi:Protein of unknown function [Cotesia congregata]|uniref:Endonuclease/exonuclease/phosphatase domain-containing protein n=1 Tax=Cotesia congregata TaxID=51543 RepID=A0A8J2HEQ2_COTCN|nr:Protein of unknown function [Cotesia congregata]